MNTLYFIKLSFQNQFFVNFVDNFDNPKWKDKIMDNYDDRF